MKSNALKLSQWTLLAFLCAGVGAMTACDKGDDKTRIGGARTPRTKPADPNKTTPEPGQQQTLKDQSPQAPAALPAPGTKDGSELTIHVEEEPQPLSTHAVVIDDPSQIISDATSLDGNEVTLIYGGNKRRVSHLDNCNGVSADSGKVRCDDGQPARVVRTVPQDDKRRTQPIVPAAPPALPTDQTEQRDVVIKPLPAPQVAEEEVIASYLTAEFEQPFLRESTDEVEVLFVVDTKKSVDWRNRVKRVMHDFKVFLENVDSDIKVSAAVLGAHSPEQGKIHGRLFNSELAGSDEVRPKVIELGRYNPDEMVTLLKSRMDRIPEDPESDGGQMGLLSLNAAITGEYLKANRQTGFFLKDAALIVIFVSNENDLCYSYSDGVKGNYKDIDNETREVTAKTKYCDGITPQKVADNLRKIKSTPIIASGFVYNKDVKFKGQENEKGHGYIEFIHDHAFLKPMIQPISSANFVDGFTHLAGSISEVLKVKVDSLIRIFDVPVGDIESKYSIKTEKTQVAVDAKAVPESDVSAVMIEENSKIRVTIPKEQAGKQGSHIFIRIPLTEPPAP